MGFFKVYVHNCELFIYLKKREQPYFEGWETQKKVIVLLFIFEFFEGCDSQ